MKILAIETSCDETGISIIEARGGKKPVLKILSNQLASQAKVHQKFGGVVPNLAKREHQRNLPILLIKVLKESKLLKISKSKFLISKQIPNSKFKIINSTLEREPELLKQTLKFLTQYQKPNIDAIAVTCGPGLEPALWTGINFAKALAYFWNLPILKISHMEGHFFSFLLSKKNHNTSYIIHNSLFPILALLVSGGHTELVYSPSLLKYKIVGETLDDAAGEAFDKGARLLGLPYPGGAELAKLAEKGNPKAFDFPRPMINSKDLNFSFSGLKTALLYKIQDLKLKTKDTKLKTDIAASYQQAIIDTLVSKTIKAVRQYQPKSLVLGGGVAANELLRKTIKEKMEKDFPRVRLFLPEKQFTTDNAAMIAFVAYFHALKKDFVKPKKLKAQANLGL